MCRLFGFRSIVQSQVHQSLVHTENALLRQSEKHPDGWGVAYYDAGVPHLIKSAQSAFQDGLYRRVSAMVSSQTVLAHIRKATAGEPSFANAHPFQYGHWVFAHNGKIGRFQALRPQILGKISPALRGRILGDTDSECFFFLILTHLSRRIDLHETFAHCDDIAAAAAGAIQELCEISGGMDPSGSCHEESTLLTFILTDGVNLIAHQGGKELHVSTYKLHCSKRQKCPYFHPVCENPSLDGRVNHVLIASEPLQGENIWHPMQFGEMLGVDSHMYLHRYSRDRIAETSTRDQQLKGRRAKPLATQSRAAFC